MKKALVTGGEGFVGSYMVPALDERGFEVTNVDLRNGDDCRDFFKVVRNVRYDLVVHLAAIVGGRATIEGNPLSVATDLAIDSDFFNWAVDTDQRHVVYYSSSAAYPVDLQGERMRRTLTEEDIDLDDVRNPDMTYGWAKLTGEYLAQFARDRDVRVDVFRPFSGYGTDQSLDYPFPSFIKRAMSRSNPFEIWGSGHQVRDWIHISDVVEGTLQWAEQRHDTGFTVNLCTGRPTSFIELAELVTTAASYTWQPDVVTQRDKPTGVMYRVGDPDLMRQVYIPRITLEEGIMRAMRGQR